MGQIYSFKSVKCNTGSGGDTIDKTVESEDPILKTLTTMEALHNNAHDIFPVPFEGLKMVLNQGLNQHFQLNYSWAFSPTEKQSGFKVGATYVGHNKISDSEIYPIMLGELSPDGNLNAQIIQQIRDDLKCKYVAQMSMNKIEGQQLSFEYKKSDVNLGLTIVNPSWKAGEVSLVVDLMRRITPNVELGSMLVMQKSARAPNKFSVWNFGGKYTSNGSNKWSISLAGRPFQSSIHATFHMPYLKPNLQIATEIEANLAQRQCVASAGYQYDFSSGVSIKSQIDSNWKIATSYERKFVSPIPFSINLCINGDVWKSAFGLGVGFSLL